MERAHRRVRCTEPRKHSLRPCGRLLLHEGDRNVNHGCPTLGGIELRALCAGSDAVDDTRRKVAGRCRRDTGHLAARTDLDGQANAALRVWVLIEALLEA